MEGKILSAAEIEEMSALPSKDALYSKVLGTMIAPITGLAVCLGQILEQKGIIISELELDMLIEEVVAAMRTRSP